MAREAMPARRDNFTLELYFTEADINREKAAQENLGNAIRRIWSDPSCTRGTRDYIDAKRLFIELKEKCKDSTWAWRPLGKVLYARLITEMTTKAKANAAARAKAKAEANASPKAEATAKEATAEASVADAETRKSAPPTPAKSGVESKSFKPTVEDEDELRVS